MIYKFLLLQLILFIGLRMKLLLPVNSIQALYFSPNYIKGYTESSVYREISSPSFSTECSLLCARDNMCKGFVVLTDKTSNTLKVCKLLNAEQQCVPEDSVDDVKYYEPRGLDGRVPDAWNEIVKEYTGYMGPVRNHDEIWDMDCYQGPCDSKGCIGISDEQPTIDEDLDFILCGSHNKDLQLIPTSGQVVQITATTDLSCGADQIVTAVMDLDLYWGSIDYFKCLSLSPEWTIDTANCKVLRLQGYEAKCPVNSNGPYYYVVGMWRTSGDDLSHLKCCAVLRK